MAKKTQLKLNGRFLAYVRVSSRDQANGVSLDVQEEQIKKYAKEKDLKIDKFFGGVESAAQTGREEFGDMIKLMTKGNYTGLIFHKADRAGRNPSDQGKLYEFMEQGHEFHFVTEHISTKEHQGRFTLYLMWAVASGYSENLKIEVAKGIGGRLRSGRYPNPAPVGYIDCGQSIKKIDTLRAPLIKKAFQMFATGNYDILAVHQYLIKQGLTNKHGTPFHPRKLYIVFRCPFYYGCISYNGEYYVGVHEPIITKELFDQVQSVLDKHSFKHIRKNQYIFPRLIDCHVCGKPLRCMSAKKGRYKYYSCRDLSCKCNIPEPLIEAQFIKDLQDLEFNDKEVDLFLKAVGAFRKEVGDSKEGEIKNLDMQLAKTKAETEQLLELYLNQKINDEEFKNMKAKLVNKEMEFSERRAALDRADSATVDQIAAIGKLLQKPTQSYTSAKSEEKKRFLVKSLVGKLSYDGEKITIHWLKQYEVIAKRPKNDIGRAAGN